MGNANQFIVALILLFAAVSVVPIFKRFGLGSVLGYLAAGALIGPWGFQVYHEPKEVMHFAELGVVILLFLIGLELKPSRLWVMRRLVFGLGGFQVLVTSIVLGAVFLFLGWSVTESLVVGFALSLSSTAFSVQLMAEKNQLNTQYGRSAFAVLLFQDLVAIPALAVVPILATRALRSAGDSADVASTLGMVAAGSGDESMSTVWIVARGLGVILGLVLFARLGLRPLLRIAANSRAREIFIAAALFIVLGVSFVMSQIGLSMALGSFLAGVLLADSEFRHQLEADLEPFKGLLLGLFFMSVGMSLNFSSIAQHPMTVVGLVLVLFLVKSVVIYILARRSNHGVNAARSLALVLSQGGEFAFVLFGIAVAGGLLSSEKDDLLTAVVTLSMPMTAVMLVVYERFLAPRLGSEAKVSFDQPASENAQGEQHAVIIAGFGRVGQIPGRLLRVLGIPFTALELDPEQVEVVRRFGNTIYYGDASRLDLLEAAGASKARAFVLAVDDVESSLNIARMVREHFPNLRIFARARNRSHVFQLRDLGVTDVWRETLDSSIELTEGLLGSLGLDSERVRTVIETFRDHDLQLLNSQYNVHHDQKLMISESLQSSQNLAELLRDDQKQSAQQ